MNKKVIVCIFAIFICMITAILVKSESKAIDSTTKKTSSMKATVLEVSSDYLTVADKNNVIYTFVGTDKDSFDIGESINIKYDGKLDKNKEKQTAKVVSATSYTDDKNIPEAWNDNGIFSEFYEMAYKKLKTMSLNEKIGQIFLVRVPEKNQISDLEKYQFGGYLLFKRDFDNKTKKEVEDMTDSFQKTSKIPLLIATDEEGGKVSRISGNTNLVSTPFKSPSELYKEGGMELIKKDTINKNEILEELGINVNLAPVVDVSTDPNSYMYERTIKENTEITSDYAKTVIEASLGSKVSYTLKHFPGYGDNADTHQTSATDNRTYSKIMEDDIPPFRAGIKKGAEAVLVSHTIVPAMDTDNPSSLSPSTHNVLRNELGFTGIIITDDLAMGAVNTSNAVTKAIKAGNDLLIVTDYEESIKEVQDAINDGTLSESLVDKMAFRIIAWKYYKGLMYSMEK